MPPASPPHRRPAALRRAGAPPELRLLPDVVDLPELPDLPEAFDAPEPPAGSRGPAGAARPPTGSAAVAHRLARALDTSDPDTGDLSTQLALEAAIDAVTRALRAHAGP